MATFGELTDLIELDLSVSSNNLLETEIQDAINRAIADYENERFEFNEDRTTFNTVALQAEYPKIGNWDNVLSFDEVQYLFAGHLYRLQRQSYEWYVEALVNQTAQTGPSNYYTLYEETLFFYPQPDSITTVTVSGIHRLTPNPLVNASDTNDFLVGSALQMIRARAKADILINRMYNVEMGTVMDGVANDYLTKLRGDRDRLVMTDSVRPFRQF